MSETMKTLKELKAAWINQDGRTATVVDVEGNVCELNKTNGQRRKLVPHKSKKNPELAYFQGDTDLPTKHGYNLPTFLEQRRIIPHQVIGFGEQNKFLVSGLYTVTNKPVILVSSGDDLIKIWAQNGRPCRAWIDNEGFIYCVNTEMNSIMRYSPNGCWAQEVLGPFDQLTRPIDIAVDKQYMYVTEEEGNIKIFERIPGHVAPILETPCQ
jgi:hypothetical protein